MKYCYNLTFVMAPEMEGAFLRWLRTEGMGLLFGPDSNAANPAVRKVEETGGEKPSPEQGLSIALQAEFASLEEARVWHDANVAHMAESYVSLFKQHPLFFSTLLENVMP